MESVIHNGVEKRSKTERLPQLILNNTLFQKMKQNKAKENSKVILSLIEGQTSHALMLHLRKHENSRLNKGTLKEVQTHLFKRANVLQLQGKHCPLSGNRPTK